MQSTASAEFWPMRSQVTSIETKHFCFAPVLTNQFFKQAIVGSVVFTYGATTVYVPLLDFNVKDWCKNIQLVILS